MNRLISVLFLISVIFWSGCSPQSAVTSDSGTMRVVVTTSIVADLVKQVGGSHVDVKAIMPPGIDPHRYIARPSDATELSRADIVFYNGLHLEGKMVDVLEKTVIRGRKPIAVSSKLDQSRDLRSGEAGSDGPHDPHIWFDVKLWSKCIDPVCDALSEIDPNHAAEFRTNAENYRKKLMELDAELHRIVSRLPAERRILVTSHDAFHYFGAAYGFEVHGLQGISTAADVGIEDRRKLVALLTEKKIQAVFGETSVPTKGLQSVLDDVKSKTSRVVQLIGGDDALYSDALGEKGTPGESYIGMCRHNVEVIVKALLP